MQETGISLSDLPEYLEQLTKRIGALEARLSTLTTSKEAEAPIDLKAAAAFTKKKPQTLYQLTSKRKIPSHKVGKHLLFFPSELQQWIKDKERYVVR